MNSKKKKHGSLRVERVILFLDQLSGLCDPYLSDHALHVRDLSVQLALRINFPFRKMQALTHAAWLHDIGKVLIPEQIINKSSRLTEAEYRMVQQHTLLGHKLIEPLAMDAMIGNAILYHHENYDGSGYPSGLRGEAIPLEARIVRITDFYDALLYPRAYRGAFTTDAAFELILNNQHCFDPLLLDEFMREQLSSGDPLLGRSWFTAEPSLVSETAD